MSLYTLSDLRKIGKIGIIYGNSDDIFNPCRKKAQKFAKVEIEAAKKIQKIWRGYHTRQCIVTFKQLYTPLAQALEKDLFLGYNQTDIKKLSFAICRELHSITCDTKGFKEKWGEDKCILKDRDSWPFTDQNQNIKTLQSPFNFSVRVDQEDDFKNPKTFSVRLIMDRRIGSGNFKLVDETISLHIPLQTRPLSLEPKSLQREREITLEETVLITPLNPNKTEQILEGIAIQQMLWDKATDLRDALSDPPRVYRSKKTETPHEALPNKIQELFSAYDLIYQDVQIEQTRYPGTLGSLISKNKLPPITTTLDNTIAQANLLERLHTYGFVHRDVKPENIFYSGAAWKLADFDCAIKTGNIQPIYFDYQYWDKCSDAGIITETVDTYGLAMTLGSMIFGEEFQKSVVSKEIRNLTSNSVFFQTFMVNTLYEKLPKNIQIPELKKDLINIFCQHWPFSLQQLSKHDPESSIEVVKLMFEFYPEILAYEAIFNLIRDVVNADKENEASLKKGCNIGFNIFRTSELRTKCEEILKKMRPN